MTNDNISILSLRMVGILEDDEESILKDERSFPEANAMLLFLTLLFGRSILSSRCLTAYFDSSNLLFRLSYLSFW